MRELLFQFSYKEQLIHEGKTPSCCQSLPISCWQNCLEGVKIEHTAKFFARPAYRESFYFQDNIWNELHHLYLNLGNKFSYLFDGDK
ncbi:hypothetical protein Pint_19731 [Pistacia integerrima]|uniref:Uncharacterized protein n=1 Tax=Pistacia integerrima TaxID=434235 RepID=A0ACC0XF19_9ROSI|nr:hypothetical protein Pint_19731 [Pistacia integerrima]